jgi:AsmA protein
MKKHFKINVTSQMIVRIAENLKIFTIDNLDAKMTLVDRQSPEETVNFTLRSTANFNFAKQNLTIPLLQITSPILQLNAHFIGEKILHDPQINGEIEVLNIAPRELIALFDQHFTPANTDVLQSAEFDSQILANSDAVTLKNIMARLDDSHITGEFAIPNTQAKRIRFNLNIDQINISNYLAQSDSSTQIAKQGWLKTASAATSQQIDINKKLPLDFFDLLQGQGQLRFAKLTFDKLNFEDVNIIYQAKNGITDIKPITAKLYGGLFTGNLQLNNRNNNYQWQLNGQLNNVQTQSLLKQLYNFDRLSGKGNMTANVTATGDTLHSILKTLNGTANLNIIDGIVTGLNADKEVARIQNLFSSTEARTINDSEQTKFNDIQGSILFKNGIANNDDLLINTDSLKITGKGKADLATRRLNYQIIATQLGANDEARGVPIPIKITGDFSSPKVAPDVHAVGEFLTTQQGQDALNNLGIQLQKRLNGKIDLKNFLQ